MITSRMIHMIVLKPSASAVRSKRINALDVNRVVLSYPSSDRY